MAERNEAVEEQAVRDGSAAYSVEPDIATTEDVPPGCKRTEMGVIPEDWKLRPLKEVFKFSNGINADKSAYGHGTPFVNVLEPITYSHIQAKDIPGKVKVPRLVLKLYSIAYGDVVFNRTSETQDELGLAAVYVGKEAVVFGGFVIRAQPVKPILDPIYSGYGLRAPLIRSQIVAKGQGAVRANIGQESLRRILAPIPPLEEQRAIATALSDADALIETLDRLIAKKGAIKQAAMQQLLTGQTRLPGFTGEWETKRLGEVAELHRRGITPAAFPDAMFQHFSLPAFDETQTPTLDLGTTIGSSKFRVPEKAVLVSKLNPRIPRIWKPESIGANAVASTEFLLFTPREGVSRDFLYVLCCSPKFVEEMELLVTGTTGSHQRISPANALKIEVMLPPSSDEQTAIAAALSDMDAEIEALENRRDKARQIKQGMMQQLLTGRVRLFQSKGLNGSESSGNAGRRTQGLVP